MIKDPNKIYAGQILTIRMDVTETVTGGTGAEGAPTDSGNVTYYTVQKGDNLWKIAVKFYGRSWRWRRIAEANDNIADPGMIYEGQVIIIPDV